LYYFQAPFGSLSEVLAVRLPISCENLQTFGDITDDTDDPIEMPMARGHFFAIFDDTKRCIDVPLHVVFGVEVPQIGRNGAWRKMWGGRPSGRMQPIDVKNRFQRNIIEIWLVVWNIFFPFIGNKNPN
jgi:hypothetical protein